jgi:hypothetical protein
MTGDSDILRGHGCFSWTVDAASVEVASGVGSEFVLGICCDDELADRTGEQPLKTPTDNKIKARIVFM